MIYRCIKLTLFFALTLLISGCNMAVLNPKGIVAAGERDLFLTAVGLMLLVVIPVIILTFVFAWRYRAKNTKTKYSPDFAHSTLLEIIWWGIPIIIIGILAVITWITAHRYDPYRSLDSNAKPLVIQVIALDWKWLFIYPEQNIATINFIQFPVNVPIRFLLTANGPMNGFQIPQLAGQIYAMAGMKTTLNIMATVPGEYAGMSTNYSGFGFSGMTFTAKASSEKDFNAWVNQVRQSPQALTQEVYDQLTKPSSYHAPEFFSSVTNNLFENIIMTFMMPMPAKVTP